MPKGPPNLPQTRIQADQAPSHPDRHPDHFMTDLERRTIVTLLRETAAQTVVEIGVQEGHMAERILRDVPSVRAYVGVDVEPGYVPSKPSQRGETPTEPGRLVARDPRFTLLTRPRGSLDLTPEDLPECDALIIDGDHGEEAVNHDTELAYARVQPGGLIIWHDYYVGEGPLDVKRVLNERRQQGALILHVEDTWLAIEHR